MNDNVRKINKIGTVKKRNNNNKNLTIKLSSGIIKPYKFDKPKIALTAKGSFVQEFKKIRREIENELKNEGMKLKSRVHTA